MEAPGIEPPTEVGNSSNRLGLFYGIVWIRCGSVLDEPYTVRRPNLHRRATPRAKACKRGDGGERALVRLWKRQRTREWRRLPDAHRSRVSAVLRETEWVPSVTRSAWPDVVDTGGWEGVQVTAISTDGRTIVGAGINGSG